MDLENKTGVSADNIDDNAAQITDTVEEKKFSQAEMDAAVKARLERERRRLEKNYAGFDGYKQVYQTLAENGVISGNDPDEAVNAIKRFYAKGGADGTGETADKPKAVITTSTLEKDDKLALAELSAARFVAKASEDAIEDEYNDLKDKGKRRSDEDDVRFAVLGKKLGEIGAKKAAQKQMDEFKAKYPKVNINELQADEDFTKLAKMSRAPLLDTYEFYAKTKGVQVPDKKEIGSVSSQNNEPKGGHYSADEIKNMSQDEINQNFAAIKESIAANIRKSMKT